MTRQIIDGRLPGGRVNETDLALMGILAARGGGRAALSRASLSAELGCSPGAARACARRLEAKGLLEVRPRHLDNGGTIENEYALTEAGKAACALALAVRAQEGR